MYSINQNTLLITKDNGETFSLLDVNNPLFSEFIIWREAGNAPSIITEESIVYKIEKYVPDDILGMKSVEHINFKTETKTPLLEKEIRNHGWLHSYEYYGYNENNGQYDDLVIRMNYVWEHNSLGFAVSRQKRLFYYDVNGVAHELKVFPKEDVSLKSIEIGRERRRSLINDLQIPTLGLIAEAILTATPQELVLWNLDINALQTNGQNYILNGVGRPFIVSLSQYITNYVDNHDLNSIQEHISLRTEGWLDKMLSINITLRQYLLNTIT